MNLTLDKFPAHLQGELAPAYLISGDEPLLVGEALDALRARARALGFSERETHFMERAGDWDSLRQSAASMSLFSARRIIEVRMPNGKPGVQGSAVLVELLKARASDQLLIIVTDRLDAATQSAAWVKALESNGAWLKIWELRRSELPEWIAQRCRRADLELTSDALALLAERIEGNLLAAHQEIEKLKLLSKGGKLDVADVLAAVSDSARFDVFKLSEAALLGDANRALRILAGLRSEGVEPTLVLWALLRELRNLWQARRADTARGGWSPQSAALAVAKRRLPRFPFERLAVRAGRADRMIKGRMAGEPWDELMLLTGEFCGIRSLPLIATARR